jgi:hypothetical protein
MMKLERDGPSYMLCPGTYLMDLGKIMKHLSGYPPVEYGSGTLLLE